MSGIKKKLSNRNMLHYVAAFCTIILLIIVSMGTYLYRFYYDQMQEDFYTNNSLYLGNISKAHENELRILKDIVTQVELSKTAKFLLEEQPTKSSDLKKQLYQYRSVNQFFDVMYCFYQKGSYLYNHITSMSIDFFCQNAYELEDYTGDELKELLLKDRRQMTILPEQSVDGEMMYYYDAQDQSAVYILPIPPEYNCILIFFIGSDHYDSLLADEEGSERNRYLIYNGQVIAKRGVCDVTDEELLSQVTGENAQKKVTFRNKSYVLTEENGASGFTYAAIQEMSVFTDNLRTHSWGIAVLLILCCLPTVMLIGYLSRRMLGGVKNINLLLSEDEEDVYALDNIEMGIRKLVNRSQSMKEDQLSLRKSRFIRNFVQSEYTALEILRRDAADAEINISLGWHMVGVMGSRVAGNEEEVFVQILAYMDGKQEIDGYGIHLMNTNQRVMVLFGTSEDILYQAYSDILQIGKKYCEEFVVAVSWHHRSLLNGSFSYLEANTAYDSRFLMDNNQIIRFTEVGQDSSISSYQNLRNRYMVQLENTIRVGSEQEVEKAIRNLCEKLEEEHATLLTFRMLYDEVLRFLMTQWKGEEKDWNQVYNVFTLSRCLTMEDFSSLLTEACHMILDTKTDVKNHQSEMVVQAIQKMQEDYGNAELNMAYLADTLGISPVTLAVEFKNETGISPSDYLAVIRLDRAKELLRTTDMLIKDISSAVGYEDGHVFIRRFKKYTGKTPGQYRKEVQEEQRNGQD